MRGLREDVGGWFCLYRCSFWSLVEGVSGLDELRLLLRYFDIIGVGLIFGVPWRQNADLRVQIL